MSVRKKWDRTWLDAADVPPMPDWFMDHRPEHRVPDYWACKLREACNRIVGEFKIRSRRPGGARSVTTRAAVSRGRGNYPQEMGEMALDYLVAKGYVIPHPQFDGRWLYPALFVPPPPQGWRRYFQELGSGARWDWWEAA